MAPRAFSPLTQLDPDNLDSAGSVATLSRPTRPSTSSHLSAGEVMRGEAPAPRDAADAANPPDTLSAAATPHINRVKRTPRPFHLDPTPSPDEIKTVQGIHQLFTAAKSHRNTLLPRWNECYRMLTNRHWNPAKRADWMPSPEIPEIFPIIRTLVLCKWFEKCHGLVAAFRPS